MNHHGLLGLTFSLMLLAVGWAVSDNTARAQETHVVQSHQEHEEHKKNDISGFVGGLTNITKDENGPSVGVNYTRRLTSKIRVGVMYEYASTRLERENLFAGILAIEPGYNLKLIFAPGAVRINEDEEEEHHGEEEHHEPPACCASTSSLTFVGRLGIGYIFELSKVSISPIVFVDLLGNSEVHLVYGVSVGFPF